MESLNELAGVGGSLHINISSQAVASGRSTALKERCLISFECNHGRGLDGSHRYSP